MNDPVITLNTERNRFETTQDGHTAWLSFVRLPDLCARGRACRFHAHARCALRIALSAKFPYMLRKHFPVQRRPRLCPPLL